MTDFDANFDIPTAITSSVPRRPRVWRVISMLAVVTAMVVSTFAILQARDASNVRELDRAPVSLQDVTVTVGDLPVPEAAEIAILGLADSESRRSFDTAGSTIKVPENSAALVALTNEDGEVVGLGLASPNTADRDIEISARSTARALLYLSPGILRPNVDATLANVAVIESDPAFENLVEAVQANSNISINNPVLEQAHAEIADRTPVQQREPDQGCDSVFASNAYPAAGTCAQPKDTGVVITNEQDRWALIYNGVDAFVGLCATIAPTGLDGSEVLIPSEQCQGESLIVAPGPVAPGTTQPTVDERIRTASAVNALFDYAGPFAEIAGASAGFTDGAIQHIRRNAPEIEQSLALLVSTNEEFAAAMDVSRTSSTALDRHNAAVAAARLIIDAADTTALIPQRNPGDSGHLSILDFFTRSGERMISERTDWRWEADSSGMIDFGVES